MPLSPVPLVHLRLFSLTVKGNSTMTIPNMTTLTLLNVSERTQDLPRLLRHPLHRFHLFISAAPQAISRLIPLSPQLTLPSLTHRPVHGKMFTVNVLRSNAIGVVVDALSGRSKGTPMASCVFSSARRYRIPHSPSSSLGRTIAPFGCGTWRLAERFFA